MLEQAYMDGAIKRIICQGKRLCAPVLLFHKPG